ncbi:MULTISPECIES: NADH-quinone oxidoreductase subunit NuoK [unclassified Paraflavitalea]|uniref:NADH-quinone oxidoreductase subunit NuoK n=1 Tax=unclassified Paraflavitalea TaxID=2798305 RepID=UPI003D32ABDD
MQIGLTHILVLSATLFFIGVYGFLTRKNLISMLMSIELMLNSANLNFIAFNKYVWPNKLEGLFFTLFIIAIAAAEAAVAMAIIIQVYRQFKSVDVDEPTIMKE